MYKIKHGIVDWDDILSCDMEVSIGLNYWPFVCPKYQRGPNSHQLCLAFQLVYAWIYIYECLGVRTHEIQLPSFEIDNQILIRKCSKEKQVGILITILTI